MSILLFPQRRIGTTFDSPVEQAAEIDQQLFTRMTVTKDLLDGLLADLKRIEALLGQSEPSDARHRDQDSLIHEAR